MEWIFLSCKNIYIYISHSSSGLFPNKTLKFEESLIAESSKQNTSSPERYALLVLICTTFSVYSQQLTFYTLRSFPS